MAGLPLVVLLANVRARFFSVSIKPNRVMFSSQVTEACEDAVVEVLPPFPLWATAVSYVWAHAIARINDRGKCLLIRYAFSVARKLLGMCSVLLR